MIRTSLFSLALVAGSVAAAAAQTHPTLAGTWVLDSTKNAADGPVPAPDHAIRTVTVHGDSVISDIKAGVAGQDQSSHTVWGADGKPWVNSLPVNGADTPVTNKASWESANVLSIQGSFEMQGNDVLYTDRWTFAADGMSYVSKRELSVGGTVLATVSTTYVKKP